VNSGLLLIATDRSSLDELDALEALAFDGALSGITTSVVSTHGALELDQLDRLALAGQGRRRMLAGPERAAEVVERELHAQAGVVARALRLNIRLAPQLKPLEGLRSARIDPAAVQRTRRIEQHIDRTIAAQLGIAADRDTDDEGIQILIPSFYAGDSHVVLLDVLAEGPGSVAEVSVRYKDLVFLRNGIAQEQLSVPAGATTAGPLERNVSKNLVARQLSAAAWTASRELTDGAPDGARITLAEMRDLLTGLRGLIPGWNNDPELARDARWLDAHIALLDAYRGPPASLNHFADSLHYASIRKLLNPIQ